MRLLSFLLLMVSLSANATSPASLVKEEAPLSHAVALTLHSAILKAPPQVHVYLPEGYHEMAEHIRYPVIYTLDGWTLSQSVAGVVAHLGQTASMPKAIVVALDSDDDYAWGPAIYASQSGWKAAPDTRLEGFAKGQADDYLAFMQKELIPLIDERYRTHDFRMLIGMSPSAAFALHTLWKAPELFHAHFVFAATDVIGMGYTPESTFAGKLAESLAATPDRRGYLYVASAKGEADTNPARARNVQALQTALAPYTARNFRLKVEHIDNFGHYPMAMPGLLNALNLVFPRKDFDMSWKFKTLLAQDDPVEALFALYDKLSAQVGFEVTPNTDLRRNANCLRVMSYRLRAQKKYAESERLYRYWIDASPKAVKAWAGLAATQEAAGDPNGALENYRQAEKFARAQQSPLLPHIEKAMQNLQVTASF